MIEITAWAREFYCVWINATAPETECQSSHAALALRDMTSEVLQLEFEQDHRHERRNELLGCTDPRHAYQWEQWQQAAHERLIGETK